MNRVIAVLLIAVMLLPAIVVLNSANVATGVTGGGQGLIADGTFFYLGADVGAGMIYKYAYGCGLSCTAVASWAGPKHANCGDIRTDHGTNQVWSTGGGTNAAIVWEITNTGTFVQSWDFSAVDYGIGACLTYIGPNTIYLLTSDASDNIDIRQVTLNDNGTFVLGSLWTANFGGGSQNDPQGLKQIIGGSLWYLTGDGGPPSLLKTITLNANGTITAGTPWQLNTSPTNVAAEGLSFDGTNWYYGDLFHAIWQIAFQSAEIRGNATIRGAGVVR